MNQLSYFHFQTQKFIGIASMGIASMYLLFFVSPFRRLIFDDPPFFNPAVPRSETHHLIYNSERQEAAEAAAAAEVRFRQKQQEIVQMYNEYHGGDININPADYQFDTGTGTYTYIPRMNMCEIQEEENGGAGRGGGQEAAEAAAEAAAAEVRYRQARDLRNQGFREREHARLEAVSIL